MQINSSYIYHQLQYRILYTFIKDRYLKINYRNHTFCFKHVSLIHVFIWAQTYAENSKNNKRDYEGVVENAQVDVIKHFDCCNFFHELISYGQNSTRMKNQRLEIIQLEKARFIKVNELK